MMTEEKRTQTMKAKATSSATAKPKNWLWANARQWHMWAGVIARAFLVVTGASGIALNYKEPVFSFIGLERKETRVDKRREAPEALKITESGKLPTVSMPLDRALEIARAELGAAPLDRIEIKDERGELIYKIKPKKGSELWINAQSGEQFHKSEHEKLIKRDNGTARQTDWGKILIDLHTGRIGGEIGKAAMSVSALIRLAFEAALRVSQHLWSVENPVRSRLQTVIRDLRSAGGYNSVDSNPSQTPARSCEASAASLRNSKVPRAGLIQELSSLKSSN
jgi:hypothetical protein